MYRPSCWVTRAASALLVAAAAVAVAAAPQQCTLKVRSASDAASLSNFVCSRGPTVVTWFGYIILESTITIPTGANVTIAGGDPTATVDGGGMVQLFWVWADAELAVRDLRLVNGSASASVGGSGGALILFGVASFLRCNFTDNAADFGGGAITIFGNLESVISCVFSGNAAGMIGGGAILTMSGSHWELAEDSIFDGNVVEGAGGAIHTSGVIAKIERCTFHQNGAAGNSGGAIASENSSSILAIRHSRFVNNWVTGTSLAAGGGAIRANGLVGYAESCTFEGNSALNGSGGAIFSARQWNVLWNCIFDKNVAAANGGAILNLGKIDVIYGCAFRENTAAGAFGGGALLNLQTITSISHSRFVANRAEGGNGTGGAISNGNELAALHGCFFAENVAASDGGSLYNSGNLQAITNSTFVNNTAGGSGGGVSSIPALPMVSNCLWEGNSAASGGGLYIGAGNSSTRLLSNVFLTNFALGNGGGFFGVLDSIDQCLFVGNEAIGGSGGAVYAELEVAGLLVNASVFAKNVAAANGGAVAGPANVYVTLKQIPLGQGLPPVDFSVVTIPVTSVVGCHFFANRASGNGGAVSGKGVQLYSDNFALNIAGNDGGAVYSETQLLDGGSSSFIGNSANGAGGAVFMSLVEGWEWPADANFSANVAGCCYNPSNGSYSCAAVDGQSEALDVCCAAGSWVDETSCVSCNDGFNCSEVGLLVRTAPLEPGWWRGNVSSAVARLCLNGQACAGGLATSSTDDYCAPGYEGPLCAVCASGFVSGVGYECRECKTSLTIASACLLPLLVVLAICAAVCYTASNLHGTALCCCTPTSRGGRLWARLRQYPFGKLRAPIVVLQIVTQYAAITGARYPAVFQNFLNFVGVVGINASVVFSMGCVISLTFYTYLLLVTLVPLGVMALLGLSLVMSKRRLHFAVRTRLSVMRPRWLSSHSAGPPLPTATVSAAAEAKVELDAVEDGELKIEAAAEDLEAELEPEAGEVKVDDVGAAAAEEARVAAAAAAALAASRQRQEEQPWGDAVARHALAFMVLTFLIYSTVATAIFQTFACDDLTDAGAKQYLRADYSIECYTSKHKFFLGYAGFMALIYPLGIPAVYGVMLRRQRLRIAALEPARDADVSIRTTRFLWMPYRRNVYWWELAECVRRLFLTGFLVFISPGTIQQAEWACVFAVLSLAAVFYFLPHENAVDAHLYNLGCFIIFGSMFLSVVVAARDSATLGGQKAVSVLIIALSVLMVAAALLQGLYIALCAPGSISESRYSLGLGSSTGMRSATVSGGDKGGCSGGLNDDSSAALALSPSAVEVDTGPQAANAVAAPFSGSGIPAPMLSAEHGQMRGSASALQ